MLFSSARSPKFLTEEEFLEAYDEHSDDVFRHCYLRTTDREQAKDIMCEAFKRLWLFIVRGNVVDSIKIFLYREANTLLHEKQLETKWLDTLFADIAAKLYQLPLEQRRVCILHFIDGFSCDEICEIIGGSQEAHQELLDSVQHQFSSLSVAHAA